MQWEGTIAAHVGGITELLFIAFLRQWDFDCEHYLFIAIIISKLSLFVCFRVHCWFYLSQCRFQNLCRMEFMVKIKRFEPSLVEKNGEMSVSWIVVWLRERLHLHLLIENFFE